MGNSFDKPIVFVTPGCPYVMRFMMFLTEARLLGKVQLIQDSKEAREHVSHTLRTNNIDNIDALTTCSNAAVVSFLLSR